MSDNEYFEACRKEFAQAREEMVQTAQRIEGYQAALLDPSGPLCTLSNEVIGLRSETRDSRSKLDQLDRRLTRIEIGQVWFPTVVSIGALILAVISLLRPFH